MSFVRMKNTVEYGDTVLLYIGYDKMLPVVVTPGQTHQTKFGAVKHSSLIGRQLGTRVECPKGWIYILNPTPELWTLSLPHRTQILYSTDISMIIFQLDLKPGSVVAEAGTGSGSLSHAIMRTIQPSGHLFTFEFHEERCQKAKEEFATHDLSSAVTVAHKDVCGEGFQLDNVVDAVFLDLPRPWECMRNSKNAIRKEGGRLCTFSPCIEQVQRSCKELIANGFVDIVTVECLAKNFNIQNARLQNVFFSETSRSCYDNPVENNSDCVENALYEFSHKKLCKIEVSPSERASHKIRDDKWKSDASNCFSSATPALAMQGHTGFLTFASLYNH